MNTIEAGARSKKAFYSPTRKHDTRLDGRLEEGRWPHRALIRDESVVQIESWQCSAPGEHSTPCRTLAFHSLLYVCLLVHRLELEAILG